MHRCRDTHVHIHRNSIKNLKIKNIIHIQWIDKIKIKWKKCPNTTLRNKEPPKMSLTSFLLVIYSLAWGLPLRVVYLPSETPMEKTLFSVANDYKLGIIPDLGWGHVSIPFKSRTPSGADPCRSRACCHSLWVNMHCLGHAVLLVLHLLELLHSFCPLFHSSLSPERRDVMETSHLWLSVFKFLHPLYIVCLWIFMFSFICCIKKLLRWCLTKAPSLEFCYCYVLLAE